MKLKFLAAAAAMTALVATGAQAQTTAPNQGMGVQQKGSISSGSGAAGQKLQEKGSASGTVGSSATRGHNGAKAGTNGSIDTQGAGASGSGSVNGSMR